jgi:thioredoxin-like negative regulator of GroEL
MYPVLAQLQAELKDQFKLVKIDGGMHTDVMKSLQVDGIPFFIIYKKGKETWRRQGVVALNELKSKLIE